MGAELSNIKLTAEEEADCKRKGPEEGSERTTDLSTTNELLPIPADNFDAFIDFLTRTLPRGSRLGYRISPEQETKLSSTLTTALIVERFNNFQSHSAASVTTAATAPDTAVSTHGTTPSCEASSDDTSGIEEEESLVPKGVEKSMNTGKLQVNSDKGFTAQELDSRTPLTQERGTKRKAASEGGLKDLDDYKSAPDKMARHVGQDSNSVLIDAISNVSAEPEAGTR
ncbi:uncharacterized protein MYCGRDRAFT_97735 [Zymoseptoria tritici IPO323]|uniref:Uncharacterized protein n=1 Tax=Zymoseptoria tritici (strain CBS 115943 / IPO323) TaxID=336722 RepID=F9XR76_ZYMTI|nr:uncharacterized protein MYCGRDRAFT_97735 [Zymoseptoria tritici IPO323]EGP82209.1 hypothetical protein MYCGRDRAFT_97735 [Zymoseptoria tritici IPO323]